MADSAPDVFFSRTSFTDGRATASMSLLDDRTLELLVSEQHGAPIDLAEYAEYAADHSRGILEQAHAAIAAFVERKAVTNAMLKNAARHALRIAKLESVARACRPGVDIFDEPDPDDVVDLLALLDIVPFDLLLDDHTLVLNPCFLVSGALVGGADADLLSGDMLVDFKTTKKPHMKVVDLDQILGYLLLALNEQRLDPTFPEVNRLAIYFCRHGYLWDWPASTWTDRPEFPELETWFINHVAEVLALPVKKAASGQVEDVQAASQLRRKKPR